MSAKEYDEIVSGAFGVAAIHLQTSMLTALVAKGYVSMKEAAEIISAAAQELDQKVGTALSPEMVVLGTRVLTDLALRWKTQAKGN
jgi:hypothetical protein